MKIFLWFSDFELQNDQGNKSTEETAVVSKEKSIFPDGDESPNKRFTAGKSFVHPLVDSKINANFWVLNGFYTWFFIQNRIDVSKLKNYRLEIGSLVYLFNLLLLSFMKFFPANLEIFYSTYVRSWDNSQFSLSNLFFDLLHLFHSRQAQCYFHGFFNHFLAIRLLIWLAKEIVRGMIVLYNIVVISQILIYHIT